jgi:hypothetical protein
VSEQVHVEAAPSEHVDDGSNTVNNAEIAKLPMAGRNY